MKFFPASAYQDELKILFNEYEKKIIRLLQNARVEHIGSSAIPNAYSKGDLDILVCIPEKEFKKSINLLKKLNFREKSNTLRTNDLCMLEAINSEKDIAFQVITEDSLYLNFLTFRDILISSPHLVDQYNQLKIDCIGFEEDDYRKVKASFIEEILYKNIS